MIRKGDPVFYRDTISATALPGSGVKSYRKDVYTLAVVDGARDDTYTIRPSGRGHVTLRTYKSDLFVVSNDIAATVLRLFAAGSDLQRDSIEELRAAVLALRTPEEIAADPVASYKPRRDRKGRLIPFHRPPTAPRGAWFSPQQELERYAVALAQKHGLLPAEFPRDLTVQVIERTEDHCGTAVVGFFRLIEDKRQDMIIDTATPPIKVECRWLNWKPADLLVEEIEPDRAAA